jgi:hypothetical protein
MADNKRTINVHFMVSEQERKMIEKRMEQTGIRSLRAYLLKMAVDGRVIHVELDSVREMVRLLSNATNNINQMTKKANETGNIHAASLDDLRFHYDNIWGQAKLILKKLSEF